MPNTDPPPPNDLPSLAELADVPELADVAGAELAALRDQLEAANTRCDEALEHAAKLELELRRAVSYKLRFTALESLIEYAGQELERIKSEDATRDVVEGFSAVEAGTPREGRSTCQHEGCSAPATHSYIWPDTATEYRECTQHAQGAATSVYMMGRVLELKSLAH